MDIQVGCCDNQDDIAQMNTTGRVYRGCVCDRIINVSVNGKVCNIVVRLAMMYGGGGLRGGARDEH